MFTTCPKLLQLWLFIAESRTCNISILRLNVTFLKCHSFELHQRDVSSQIKCSINAKWVLTPTRHLGKMTIRKSGRSPNWGTSSLYTQLWWISIDEKKLQVYDELPQLSFCFFYHINNTIVQCCQNYVDVYGRFSWLAESVLQILGVQAFPPPRISSCTSIEHSLHHHCHTLPCPPYTAKVICLSENSLFGCFVF
jgi:hypothetical protein